MDFPSGSCFPLSEAACFDLSSGVHIILSTDKRTNEMKLKVSPSFSGVEVPDKQDLLR